MVTILKLVQVFHFHVIHSVDLFIIVVHAVVVSRVFGQTSCHFIVGFFLLFGSFKVHCVVSLLENGDHSIQNSVNDLQRQGSGKKSRVAGVSILDAFSFVLFSLFSGFLGAQREKVSIHNVSKVWVSELENQHNWSTQKLDGLSHPFLNNCHCRFISIMKEN